MCYDKGQFNVPLRDKLRKTLERLSMILFFLVVLIFLGVGTYITMYLLGIV